MRTNIVIDDALLDAAMKAGPFSTKKDAVEAGLRLLARQAAYRDILALRGGEAFVKLMEFQAGRARGYYEKALATLPAEDRRSQRAGLIMAAIAIWTSACRPPSPRPCSTRQAISVSTDCARPASIDPTMNTMMESCSSSFLLNRSDSLPQMGVEAVEDSSVAVTTQV